MGCRFESCPRSLSFEPPLRPATMVAGLRFAAPAQPMAANQGLPILRPKQDIHGPVPTTESPVGETRADGCLAQSYIQVEHHQHAGQHAQRRPPLVLQAVGLGDDLIADHIKHGPSGKAHGVGENGGCELHRHGA